MIFILTILLLAADFYYLKNIAGRRLVGLRWWNEVDTASGNSHWVFESQDRGSTQNLTDKRFFWLALYAQPGLWVGLAIFAIVRFENPIWLSLVGEFARYQHRPFRLFTFSPLCPPPPPHPIIMANLPLPPPLFSPFALVIALILTITNTLAFSRCDKFSHATNLASNAMYSGGIARNLAGGVFSRFFSGNR